MNNYEIRGRLHQARVTERLEDRTKIFSIMRGLAHKYQVQCENDCNGHGYIPGKGIVRCDGPGGYAADGETTLFQVEQDRLQTAMCKVFKPFGQNFRLKFQGDPRGWVVRIERKFGGTDWRDDGNLGEILWTR